MHRQTLVHALACLPADLALRPKVPTPTNPLCLPLLAAGTADAAVLLPITAPADSTEGAAPMPSAEACQVVPLGVRPWATPLASYAMPGPVVGVEMRVTATRGTGEGCSGGEEDVDNEEEGTATDGTRQGDDPDTIWTEEPGTGAIVVCRNPRSAHPRPPWPLPRPGAPYLRTYFGVRCPLFPSAFFLSLHATPLAGSASARPSTPTKCGSSTLPSLRLPARRHLRPRAATSPFARPLPRALRSRSLWALPCSGPVPMPWLSLRPTGPCG